MDSIEEVGGRVVSYGGDVDVGHGRPSEKVRPTGSHSHRSGQDQPAMTRISTSSAPRRADIEKCSRSGWYPRTEYIHEIKV